ncbi:MAG: hypothetical protein NUW37_08405 [Planctomycetes bacterium]|nr:hypothetical protein [Planctomycetota bacterium]
MNYEEEYEIAGNTGAQGIALMEDPKGLARSSRSSRRRGGDDDEEEEEDDSSNRRRKGGSAGSGRGDGGRGGGGGRGRGRGDDDEDDEEEEEDRPRRRRSGGGSSRRKGRDEEEEEEEEERPRRGARGGASGRGGRGGGGSGGGGGYGGRTAPNKVGTAKTLSFVGMIVPFLGLYAAVVAMGELKRIEQGRLDEKLEPGAKLARLLGFIGTGVSLVVLVIVIVIINVMSGVALAGVVLKGQLVIEDANEKVAAQYYAQFQEIVNTKYNPAQLQAAFDQKFQEAIDVVNRNWSENHEGTPDGINDKDWKTGWDAGSKIAIGNAEKAAKSLILDDLIALYEASKTDFQKIAGQYHEFEDPAFKRIHSGLSEATPYYGFAISWEDNKKIDKNVVLTYTVPGMEEEQTVRSTWSFEPNGFLSHPDFKPLQKDSSSKTDMVITSNNTQIRVLFEFADTSDKVELWINTEQGANIFLRMLR